MSADRVRALACALLPIRRGIEKESLRVTRSGALAATPHPRRLGSPLTHPHITTDFSEAQVEMVTGVHASPAACADELMRIQQVVQRAIGDEVLWCASMPGELPPEAAIPIAHYGSSNLGRVKHVYRLGLSYRYGRRMQMISGIHYNFSVPPQAWTALQTDADAGYFALMRNFRRHAWLLLYLFGASPAACRSFVEGRAHELEPLGSDTVHGPHATSLRMGPLGYRSDVQASLRVSYNDLGCYVAALERALGTSHPAYEAIGIRAGGHYRQLSTSLLQIENEFYATIRPKRRTRRGERLLHALRARGVEYVEVRALDLDPFSPIGIDTGAMRMLDVFLLHCLLADSGPETVDEAHAIARNQYRVAERGRLPGLQLERQGARIALAAWALEILQACEPIAAALDAPSGTGHIDALKAAVRAVREPDVLPSARVLTAMQRDHDGSHARFVLAQSLQHARTLRAARLPAAVKLSFERMARASAGEQSALEAADHEPFEDFRREYLAPSQPQD